jgi:glycosyltransferase involved in cell wall biosynthesis
MSFAPQDLEFVFLSFEGPDQPYSQAGGLGVRVTQLTRALARNGFDTHLIFVGDPELPGTETREDGRLNLYRWCQWISAHHPEGVYAGEIEKVHDYQDSVPAFVTQAIVQPALRNGRRVAVIAEEWHTADALTRLSDSLHFLGIGDAAVMLWNANNDMSFDRVHWDRLGFVADFAAVSRYIKTQMWSRGINPLVIPNGIPSELLQTIPEEDLRSLREAVGPGPWFFKIGRMDPDKGWLPAVEAIFRLRDSGVPARLVMKGGHLEGHGTEIYRHMAWRDLHPDDVHTNDLSLGGIAAALRAADPEAGILNLNFFVPDDALPAFYSAADGVLANSGYEPFGLVGLEAMAAGGIAYVGSTGEDYAIPLRNCIVLDDPSDPDEIMQAALLLIDDDQVAARLRANARTTARLHTWNALIPVLLSKLAIAARRQGLRGL